MKQRGSGAAAKRGNVNRGMAESRSSWGSSGVADGEAPSLASGRVETNIVRDANDRKRMAGTHGGLCIECIITCPSRCCLYCVLVKGMRTVYYHGSCSQHCLSGCLLQHGVLNSYVRYALQQVLHLVLYGRSMRHGPFVLFSLCTVRNTCFSCALRLPVAPWSSGRGKTAASNYTVLESLYGGRAALVQWQLDTGRTHQIRWVHFRHYAGTCMFATRSASIWCLRKCMRDQGGNHHSVNGCLVQIH